MTPSDSSLRLGSGVTELPFGLPGRVLRSYMPFSDFDPTGELWDAYRILNVDTVVVLAEREETLIRTGMDLFAFYRGQGLRVLHVPIRDHSSPADAAALSVAVDHALERARGGSNLAVHCYAGIGRSGVFLALLARRALGLEGEEAIAWVRRWIPGALETPGQQEFVRNWVAPSS